MIALIRASRVAGGGLDGGCVDKGTPIMNPAGRLIPAPSHTRRPEPFPDRRPEAIAHWEKAVELNPGRERRFHGNAREQTTSGSPTIMHEFLKPLVVIGQLRLGQGLGDLRPAHTSAGATQRQAGTDLALGTAQGKG